MLKKRRRGTVLPLLAAALLAALLCGCGANTYPASRSYETAASGASAPMEIPAPMPDGAWIENGWAEAEAKAEDEPAAPAGETARNVKMIYTANLDLESTDFDAAAAGLERVAAEHGGWLEHSQMNNSNRGYRSAYYTVRVPAERFESFCARVGDLCKVVSVSRDQQDVSEAYYDVEARLATQRTKLQRLQELLAKAEDMEDIIALESALAETELAIEQLTGSLRHFDSLVDYATIHISLSEVAQLTKTEEPAIGFGAQLGAALRAGGHGFAEGMEDLLLDMARGWVAWLFFLVLVAVAVIVTLRVRRRMRRRRTQQPWSAGAPASPPAREASPDPERNTEEQQQ